MQTMTFKLDISAEKYQAYYQGSAKSVVVRSEDGRTIKFPASSLRQFVRHNGIQGRFEIVFDDHFKLVAINPL